VIGYWHLPFSPSGEFSQAIFPIIKQAKVSTGITTSGHCNFTSSSGYGTLFGAEISGSLAIRIELPRTRLFE
jgi:hypothetical protein